jgi:hypothetical protein
VLHLGLEPGDNDIKDESKYNVTPNFDSETNSTLGNSIGKYDVHTSIPKNSQLNKNLNAWL